MQVRDKGIVISGGASGLGEACARLFVESGARAALLDVNDEAGERLARELGSAARFFHTDVCDEASVREAVAGAAEAFGAVHAAVSCAGVAHAAKVLGRKGTFPMALFEQVLRINLIGTMHMVCSAVREMMQNTPDEDGERGVIVTCGSGAAFFGQVGQAAYSASKAGVAGMTLPIAREIGEYGMRIVSIAPGLFETPLTAGMPEVVKTGIVGHIPFPKRLGRPREFALMARHVVENPYLNGRPSSWTARR